MRVVFLDIDGVLNYTKWYIDDRNPGNLYGQEEDIDPLCIERVMKICNLTNAKVVVSSDWRIDWKGTRKRLSRMGLDENYVIDKTPEFIWNNLSDPEYLEEDWDRTDFTKEQHGHFVHIDPYEGLTDEDTIKSIEILTGNINI